MNTAINKLKDNLHDSDELGSMEKCIKNGVSNSVEESVSTLLINSW